MDLLLVYYFFRVDWVDVDGVDNCIVNSKYTDAASVHPEVDGAPASIPLGH
jgi:hypothetical protein